MSKKARPIFNSEIKSSFLATLTPDRKRLALAFFRDAAPFEEIAGRDISSFSDSESIGAARRAFSTMLRRKSRLMLANVINSYYRWCIANNVPDAVEHKPIPMELVNEVSDELLIFSPAHLQTIMDKVFDPESDGTVDNAYRCFLWMAYAGLSIESAVALKEENFLLQSFQVSINDEIGVLYPQAIPCLQNCINMKQFTYKHPNYPSVMKDRVPGDYILRGTRGAYNDMDRVTITFRTILARRCKQSGVNLTYNSCYYNGLYYRIHESELCHGEAPDFNYIAAQTPAGKRVMTSVDQLATSKRARLYQIALRLKADYEIWKEELKKR